MTKGQAIQILMLLSKIEGFARGTHKNEMLPDDMWAEMQNVVEILASFIKESK